MSKFILILMIGLLGMSCATTSDKKKKDSDKEKAKEEALLDQHMSPADRWAQHRL